jgi:hypothetical protein
MQVVLVASIVAGLPGLMACSDTTSAWEGDASASSAPGTPEGGETSTGDGGADASSPPEGSAPSTEDASERDVATSESGPLSDAGTGDAARPDSGVLARRVNWYLNRNDTSANVAFVTAHRSSLTGVYLCCNAFSFDDGGAFTASASDAEIQAQVSPLAALGLHVYYVVSITDAAVASGAYKASIADAVASAQRNHFEGYVSDYEPSTNYTLAHEQAYATFLGDMTAALHAASPQLSFGVDVAGWGILHAWSVYAPVGLDVFTSMNPTYSGASLSTDEAFVTGEAEGGIPVDHIAVGISTMLTGDAAANAATSWPQSELQTFVSWVGQRGVPQIDVWRSDIDSYAQTEPYTFTILEGFLAGP